MTVRQIVYIPDAVLRKKAKKIATIDESTKKLVDDMVETMRDAPGVGLAAPQVGVSQRLVVIEFGDDEDESVAPKLYVLINPEIVQYSEEKVMGVEGCLSVPGLVGTVDRSESVVIKALNRQGKPQKIKASGWLARIFQHEIDHLEGVVYTDRAEKVWPPQEDDEFADV